MRTDEFRYDLPPELIAQEPLPRGESRLMVLHRAEERMEIVRFSDLPGYLRPGDTLVINNSRVTARRLSTWLDGGKTGEALLLRPCGDTDWEALVRPGKQMRTGARLTFELRDRMLVTADVVAHTPEGGRILRFADRETRDRLAREGTVPLPPYIHAKLADEERYQTVYAGPGGSAAAPTAGLHFTPQFIAQSRAAGIEIARVTLHVGVDTFRPVRSETVETHVMHGEEFSITPDDAERINATTGRIIAIGTTAVRALETAAIGPRRVRSMTGVSRLFITPGFSFQIVQALLTNFHLPESTLLMLVSVFAGRNFVMRAYRKAIEERFRFYSFGDAMLIL